MSGTGHAADAVLALLGGRGGTGGVEWERIEWERVVAFASAHLVLPALAAPLKQLACHAPIPDDLLAFVWSMHAANQTRNLMLRAALLEMTAKLGQAGIEPMALKGATFLSEDSEGAAPWRFMSDLDLLIAPDQLAQSVGVLEELGYAAVKTDYDPARVAHYPPLIAPCGRFSVELHTRVFAFGDYGMAASDVLAHGVRSAHTDLMLPSARHRMVHVLAHSQLHNRNFPIFRLVLKDFLDIATLVGERGPAVFPWQDVEACFGDPDERRRAMALVAAWSDIMPAGATGAVQLSGDVAGYGARWARIAGARLRRPPARARFDAVADTVRVELHRMITEKGHVAHRCRQLIRPRELAAAADTFTHKMRQRLWR